MGAQKHENTGFRKVTPRKKGILWRARRVGGLEQPSNSSDGVHPTCKAAVMSYACLEGAISPYPVFWRQIFFGSTSPWYLFNVTFEDLSFEPNFKLIEALHGGLPKNGGWVEVEKKLVAGSRWIGGSKDLFRLYPS